ncbi:MAG: MarR family transcriptional regulator [Victivallaceae bacterium]|nr:MarR family transcriptional regulator [Victivallaceae bacterium]
MDNSETTSDNHTPNVESFKRMCRFLELKRRQFLTQAWRNDVNHLPHGQFLRLMQVRYAMPCNLGRIIEVTELTPAGASIFVDNLVERGILLRKDDANDRRNVRISLTDKGIDYLRSIEDGLNNYIMGYFADCTDEQRDTIDKAMKILCSKIEERDSSPV